MKPAPQGDAGFKLGDVNWSFRKRLADHGLSAAEVEIALAYIIKQTGH